MLDETLKGQSVFRIHDLPNGGASWSGKDLFKPPLGKHPPNPCTICAEHPVKIQSVSSSKIQTMLGNWREVSPEQLLPSIGRFIRKNAKKHWLYLIVRAQRVP